MNALQVVTSPEAQKNFYPTPESLIHEMLKDVEFYKLGNVLEPSAGKGNNIVKKNCVAPKKKNRPDLMQTGQNTRNASKNAKSSSAGGAIEPGKSSLTALKLTPLYGQF